MSLGTAGLLCVSIKLQLTGKSPSFFPNLFHIILIAVQQKKNVYFVELLLIF